MRKQLLLLFIILSTQLSFSQVEQNWQFKGFGPHSRTINAVQILNTGRIIAVGGNETNDAISSIFYSDDSATNWNIIIDTINAWLKDVHFPTTSVGYAVGYAGKVYKTINGGNTWSAIVIPGNAGARNFNGVYFINSTTGIIVGGNQSNDSIQTILRTVDGGQSWSVVTDALGSWLLDVEFVDSNNGYAVGERGKILYTSDGGQSWANITVPVGLADRKFTAVHFFDSQIGIGVGGKDSINDSIQTIIKTIDGGLNWNVIEDSIGSMLKTVHFIDTNAGYVAGNNGVIKFSGNQGLSWTAYNIAGNDNNAINDIDFLNSDFGVAEGVGGKILVYNSMLSLSTFDISNNVNSSFQLYPNPANNRLTIRIVDGNKKQIQEGEITIYNVLGEELKKQKISNLSEITDVDISSLPAQLYMLSLKMNNQIMTKNFIKN